MAKISFIIPNWNGKEYLARCLNSIIEASSPGYEKEIIVVDNASADGSMEMIEDLFPQARLICNDRNLGYAKAVNQGVEASGGEILFLLNNDVVLKNDSVAVLLEKLISSSEIGAVSPLLYYPDGRLQISCRRFPHPVSILLEKVNMDSFVGFRRLKLSPEEHIKGGIVMQPMFSAIMIKRECWQDVGPLDESFPIFFNDVEWCYRLYKNTPYVIVLVPAARALHYEGVSVKRLGYKKRYYLYTGLARFYMKNRFKLHTSRFVG